MPEVLQNVVLPTIQFDAPPEMYVRLNDNVRSQLKGPCLVFTPGGRAYFDTFYNGLTVASWKGICGVSQLSLRLQGSGDFILRLGLHRMGYAHHWLDELEISLQEGEAATFPLAFWPQLTQGILYFSLQATGVGSLESGSFETNCSPRRDVKLGLVITHFQRQEAILPALHRIREKVLQPGQCSDISLVVVDNSQDLSVTDAIGATVLPNRNLGGSGGFMRGLLHLKDNEFTHCLFMDDDAFCEPESILRCYKLLKYAISERVAVAGALLREVEPFRLFEKGAYFKGICKPLKQGLDMRHVGDLLEAERVDKIADYGGWWFFGFAISAVKHYAFPFFVRGDDIQFSALNDFEIITMNGISCWGEDFSVKHGPMTEYLDTRYHILQSLCIDRTQRRMIASVLCQFFFFDVLSYNYATARAVTLAMRDVMKGPAFWLEDMDMQDKREKIKRMAVAETMRPIDRRQVRDVQRLPEHELRIRRAFRLLTLNGFLLPPFLLKNETVFQNKGFKGALRNTFRFRRVLYEHEPSQTGYIAQHNKREFFAALLDFAQAIASFIIICDRLRREYLIALPGMTSELFWREIYSVELVEKLQAKEPSSNKKCAKNQLSSDNRNELAKQPAEK